MNRKTRYQTLYIISATICIFGPLLFTLQFPRYIFYVMHLSYIALPIVAVYLLLPRSKSMIHLGQRNLPTIKWLLLIFAIEILSTSLFLGQTYTLGQYEVSVLHVTQPSLPLWFGEQVKSLLKNYGVFPWTYIGLLIIIFHSAQKQSNHPNAFSQVASQHRNKHRFYIKRAIDIYLTGAFRVFIAMFMALLIVQVFAAAFPGQNVFFNTFWGLTIAMVLILFSYSKYFKSISAYFTDMHPPVIVQLLFLLIISSIVALAFTWLSTHLTPAMLEKIKPWKPMRFFSNAQLPFLDQLWRLSWWLIIAPLLATLFIKISHQHSLRKLILATLILPFMVCVLSFVFNLQAEQLTDFASLGIWIQLLGTLAILILFSNRYAHHFFWFGYCPLTTVKKTRGIDFARFWIITIALLGLFALLGVQAMALAVIIPGIALLLMFLLCCHRAMN